MHRGPGGCSWGGCRDNAPQGQCNLGAWVVRYEGSSPLASTWGLCSSCLGEGHSVLLCRELPAVLEGVEWVLPYPSASPDGCCSPGRSWVGGVPKG